MLEGGLRPSLWANILIDEHERQQGHRPCWNEKRGCPIIFKATLTLVLMAAKKSFFFNPVTLS